MNGPEREPGAVRVFLCDDAEDLRLLLRLTLDARADVRVVGEAADARTALAALPAADPDVIVLDLGMPGWEGADPIGRVRAAAPRAHVVVYSGRAAGTEQAAALGRGARAYVQKGAPLDRLCAAVVAAGRAAQGRS